ncbi:MAG: CoA-binding protein [Lentisphaerae bacterium]|jgi:acetate---CoA ligase (ADP-forming)|nr:CoA-binding protein [Lentisphaerota bacterium]MBT4820305.1 CoA-binding protein [Lentisphaerota bacterium]MBT5604768.1 CoA-binding protein [Lentisphaerota bacterium]MBT7053900.1 CoA-binding protein [Lentisphaerota bacterium]MBT7842822.1 CoA-binding protein [Lentisphaerota bacterium]
MTGLDCLFNPQSVAIVGASREPGKVGHEIVSAMLAAGFEGQIFPVNPKADEIEGLPCFPDLPAIGAVPELVVIVVSSKFVLKVIEQCATLGVKAAVIITSGFKESGDSGAELEKQVSRVARSHDLRLVGPNCIGVMSTRAKLNASFAGELPAVGGVGYLSQSGSLLAAIVDMANASGIGFSKLISIGNKADVNELDVMRHFGEDPETEVVAGYLETIGDGDAFIRQAEMVSQRKPILLIKSGVTDAGARAASSHTGRLAGTESAYECVFERAGVIRCESIKMQFDLARAFANQPLPLGGHVAVIANAGGAGIMAADAIDRGNLELAPFSDETMQVLTTGLPKAANISNPIDLLGDALSDRYEIALSAVLSDPGVDSVLVMLSPHATTECVTTAKTVARCANAQSEKPVLACFLGAGRIREAVEVLRAGGIPQYDSPESAVATIKAMSTYSRWRARPKRVVKLFPVNRHRVERVIRRHLRQGVHELGEVQTKDILQAYGFVTPKSAVATTAEQAANIAAQIGYPVVLKVWAPEIIHKTDVGGVKTDLTGSQAVMDAFDLMMYRIPKKLPDVNIPGILVEQMCTTGREVILGMNRDPRFGPLMMFGMGGKLVEVLEDVVFYPAPLTAEEAKEMLVSTRTYELLAGLRGEEGVDIDAIAEALQRLSQLVTEFPQIKEIDINPFVVGLAGTTPVAADAMMTIEPA